MTGVLGDGGKQFRSRGGKIAGLNEIVNSSFNSLLAGKGWIVI